jgi:hypothetical protein
MVADDFKDGPFRDFLEAFLKSEQRNGTIGVTDIHRTVRFYFWRFHYVSFILSNPHANKSGGKKHERPNQKYFNFWFKFVLCTEYQAVYDGILANTS